MNSSVPRTPDEYRLWWAENTDVPYGECWCGCGAKTGLADSAHAARCYVRGEPRHWAPGHQNRKTPALQASEYRAWWADHYPEIPFGYCVCGCGQQTEIATKSRSYRVHVKGQPKRYIEGHRRSPRSFDYIVDVETGCWIWQGSHDEKGYPLNARGRVHRQVYEGEYGSIPKGAEIDHVCQRRRCIRAEHLRAISHTENIRRAKNTKLTLDDARQIRALRKDGHPVKDIAKQFDVSLDMVYRLLRGEYWKESRE
jgi:hypothetical protein